MMKLRYIHTYAGSTQSITVIMAFHSDPIYIAYSIV